MPRHKSTERYDMTIIDDPKNKAAVAVYESLPTSTDAAGAPVDEWSDTAAVATAVDLSVSTVRGVLRKLAAEGLVERYQTDRTSPALWRSLPRPAQTEAPLEAPQDEPGKDACVHVVSELDDVVASMERARPVSAPPAPVSDVPASRGRPVGISNPTDSAWANGGIKTAVERVLQGAPDRDWSPTELARHIGHDNTGAVGNACHRLAAQGVLRLVQVRPKRYAAA